MSVLLVLFVMACEALGVESRQVFLAMSVLLCVSIAGCWSVAQSLQLHMPWHFLLVPLVITGLMVIAIVAYPVSNCDILDCAAGPHSHAYTPLPAASE